MILGLSVTTLLLLLGVGVGKASGRDVVTARERQALYRWAVASGIVVYPLALGVGPFDPYALGFLGGRVSWLLGAVALGSALALWHRRDFLFLALVAGVAAFSLQLGASNNLWDYLLDPWLVAFAGLRLALGSTRLTIL